MGYSKLDYRTYLEDYDYWRYEVGIEAPKWAAELSEYGTAVSAIDFYDDIFSGGSDSGSDLEPHRDPEDYRTGEYAAIALEIVNRVGSDGKGVRYGRRVTITQGCDELYNLIEESENFCLVAPISYAGRKRSAASARYLYALCVEIDAINPVAGIKELFYVFERKVRMLARPTYIVCSGTGLHLYWVFEKPIPLFKNIVLQLQKIREYIIFCTWDKQISLLWENVQHESLYQAFRCVGTYGKNKRTVAMAFEVGERLSIEKFNEKLPDALKLEAVYKSDLTRAQAKELYPDWYQRRVVEKQGRGHYTRHEGIYYDWISKIMNGAEVGHRYNCLENLCALAVQCEIPPEQVYADCQKVKEKFETMTNDDDNHFTEFDVLCALRTYETKPETAYRRRIEYISKKTGIPLQPAKRNGRKRKDHIVVMNKMKEVKKILGEDMHEGRPSAQDAVKRWRENHPDGRKVDCIRDTGLDKKTVYKWW